MPRNKNSAKRKIARRPLSSAKKTARKSGNSVALKNTVKSTKRSRTKAELKYVQWQSVPVEDLNPLLQRHFIVGEDIMVARVLMKRGCLVPLHSHHNEQFTYILEGALKFWIDGQEIVVRAGEVLTIPRNMPHKAEALEDTVDLDVFNPPRADWINKTDQYLRKAK